MEVQWPSRSAGKRKENHSSEPKGKRLLIRLAFYLSGPMARLALDVSVTAAFFACGLNLALIIAVFAFHEFFVQCFALAVAFAALGLDCTVALACLTLEIAVSAAVPTVHFEPGSADSAVQEKPSHNVRHWAPTALSDVSRAEVVRFACELVQLGPGREDCWMRPVVRMLCYM